MPKTKFQEFVYGVLMTFFMVLAMERITPVCALAS